MGVGHGYLAAAGRIAHWAGHGAGRSRPDLECAVGRDPGHRAAARADGDDVDHRNLGRKRTDPSFGRHCRLAVEDDRHIGRGAAPIAGQHPVEPGLAGNQRGTEHPGSWPRQHGRDRLMNHLGARQHSAVGLHHVERDSRSGGTKIGQPARDGLHVAADGGLHGGINERRHRPLVLAILRQHLAGQRNDRGRIFPTEHVTHAQLVRRVGVGVQEADTDRVDAALGEEASRGNGLCLVERLELGAGVVESAANGAHQVGRDDAVRLDPEVAVPISVRHRLPGDLQHELVAVGGDETEARDPPFEQLVGGNSRAVADRRDDALIGLDHPEHLHDAKEESLSRIGRRRRCLGGNDLAGVFIDRDDVGKRPAGVDSDADPAA